MKQYICDMCGKKSSSVTFTLPVWVQNCVELYGQEAYQLPPTIITKECNLCDDCQIKIADMIG